MNAHPAGPRHAEETRHASGPPRPQSAEELLNLAPNVWPRNTTRDDDGVAGIAGVKLTDLAHEYGPRCSSSTRTTSAAAAERSPPRSAVV